MIPIVLMAIIGILNPSLFNSANADVVLSTNDSIVKVAAPNELAVMAEMLGGNVISFSQVTLDISGMPQFLSTFGVSSNNVKADPWITNYNTSGYSGSDKTNRGWNGYAGNQLKPISNATATVLPTSAAALLNKPDVILQFHVGNDTTTANSNGYACANGNPVSMVDPFGTSTELGGSTAETVVHTVLDVLIVGTAAGGINAL